MVTGKHTDPVWQICWQEADLQKQLQFFSVASDGRVTLWTLEKSELTHQVGGGLAEPAGAGLGAA